jgi:hypothetical protein
MEPLEVQMSLCGLTIQITVKQAEEVNISTKVQCFGGHPPFYIED